MKNMRILTVSLSLCLVTLLWSSVTMAQEKPLLCALNQATECNLANGCSHRSIESVNLPDFINIDLQGKKLHATGANDDESTKIKTLEKTENTFILQGSENGRGWTIDLNKQTGKFTAVVAESQTAFVIFGSCIQSN